MAPPSAAATVARRRQPPPRPGSPAASAEGAMRSGTTIVICFRLRAAAAAGPAPQPAASSNAMTAAGWARMLSGAVTAGGARREIESVSSVARGHLRNWTPSGASAAASADCMQVQRVTPRYGLPFEAAAAAGEGAQQTGRLRLYSLHTRAVGAIASVWHARRRAGDALGFKRGNATAPAHQRSDVLSLAGRADASASVKHTNSGQVTAVSGSAGIGMQRKRDAGLRRCARAAAHHAPAAGPKGGRPP